MEVFWLQCQVCSVSFDTISAFKLHLHSHGARLKEIFPEDDCHFMGYLPNIDFVNVKRNCIFKNPYYIHGLSQLTLCFSPGKFPNFYLCHTCKDKCTVKRVLHHVLSKDHERKAISHTDPNLMDFSWIPGKNTGTLKIDKTNQENVLRMLQMPPRLLFELSGKSFSKVMEILSENKKVLELLPAFPDRAITQIETYQKDSNRKYPLLGMQHLVECICEEMDDKIFHLCTLCHLTVNAYNIIMHVLSFDHIFSYFNEWHPTTLVAKASYKNNIPFRSMMLNLSKQAEEISGINNVMKKVSLNPAEFTALNSKCFAKALKELESIKKCSFETSVKPAGKLVTRSAPLLAKSPPSSKELEPSLEKSEGLSGKSAPLPAHSASSSGKSEPSPAQSVPSLEKSALLLAQSAPSSSGKSAPSPVQSAHSSAKSATSPAQSVLSAGKSVPSPARSTSSAEKSALLPAQLAPSLEKSAPLPAQTALPSAKSAPSPGQSTPSSGKTTPSPAQSAPLSGKSAPSPAQSASSAGKSAPSPAQSASLARKSSPSPAQSAPLPGKLAPSPAQSTLPAGKSVPSPAQSASSALKSAPSPAQSAPSLGKSPPLPAQSTPSTGKSALSPAQSALSAGESAPTPAQSATSSGKSAPLPAQSSLSSTKSAPSPAQLATSSGKSSPIPAQSASSAGKSAPTAAQSATSSGRCSPLPAQSASSAGKSAPSPAQCASSTGKSAPTPAQSASSSGKSASSPSQSTSSSGNSTSGQYVRHSKSSAKTKPVVWPLHCQNCDEFFPNMFKYRKHLVYQQHKQNLRNQFIHDQWCDNFDRQGCFYLDLYSYVQQRVRSEEPFVGMPFVVSCASTGSTLPPFYTCFACMDSFDGNLMEHHFKSQKHLLLTLFQYQNPDLLPFAWKSDADLSSKELRRKVFECERLFSTVPLKVLELPAWKFSQIIEVDYANVQTNLKEHLDLWSNGVPLIENNLQLQRGNLYPLLGRGFLVLYEGISLRKNLPQKHLLCLLCDRDLTEKESYAHIYSMEHVSLFLECFHPGSLNASNVNAETIFDFAQQASNIQPRQSMQAVQLVQVITMHCSFLKKKKILRYGATLNGVNMVVPPIFPRGKLVPSKKLLQKQSTKENNNPKINSDPQRPSANEGNRLKEESLKDQSEETLDVITVKNTEESCLVKEKPAEEPIIQIHKPSEANPCSCSLNPDTFLEKENQTEVNKGKEDVGEEVSKSVSSVNGNQKRKAISEETLDVITVKNTEESCLVKEKPAEEPIIQIHKPSEANPCSCSLNPDTLLEKENQTEVNKGKEDVGEEVSKSVSSVNGNQKRKAIPEDVLGGADCIERDNKRPRLTREEEFLTEEVPKTQHSQEIKEEIADAKDTHNMALEKGLSTLFDCRCGYYDRVYLCEYCSLKILQGNIISHITELGHPKVHQKVVNLDLDGYSKIAIQDFETAVLTIKACLDSSKSCPELPQVSDASSPPAVTQEDTPFSLHGHCDINDTLMYNKLKYADPSERGDSVAITDCGSEMMRSLFKTKDVDWRIINTNAEVFSIAHIEKVNSTPLMTEERTIASKKTTNSSKLTAVASTSKSTNIAGVKTKTSEKAPKSSQTSFNASVTTNKWKEAQKLHPEVQKTIKTCTDSNPQYQPYVDTETHARKNPQPDVSRLAMATTVGFGPKQTQAEHLLMVLKKLESMERLPKIGANQVIRVTCPIKDKLKVFCKLCSVKVFNSQHMCSIEHHCKFLQMLFPGWTPELMEIQQKVRDLAIEEKRQGNWGEKIEVTWEQYEELGNYKAPLAIERIKHLLKNKPSANPSHVSQNLLQGSPCEVSSSDGGADGENPLRFVQLEDDYSSQFFRAPDVSQEAHVRNQPQLLQGRDPRLQNPPKILQSRWKSLTEVGKSNPENSLTIPHNVLQNQQRPPQKDACETPHDQAHDFSISGQQIQDPSNVSKYLPFKNPDSKPIVGKQFVWECRGVSCRTFFLCESCEEMIYNSDICQHLLSEIHQLNYVRKNHSKLLDFWDLKDISRINKLKVLNYVVNELSIQARERDQIIDVKVALLGPELHEHLQKAPFCEALKVLQSIIKQKQGDTWAPVCTPSQKSQHTEATKCLEKTLAAQRQRTPILETDQENENGESRLGSEEIFGHFEIGKEKIRTNYGDVTSLPQRLDTVSYSPLTDGCVSPKNSHHSLSKHPEDTTLDYQQTKDLVSTLQEKENMGFFCTPVNETQCLPDKSSRKRPPGASLETLVKSFSNSSNDDSLPEKCKQNPGPSQPTSESTPETVNPSSSSATVENRPHKSNPQAKADYFAALSNIIVQIRQKPHLLKSSTNVEKSCKSVSNNSKTTKKITIAGSENSEIKQENQSIMNSPVLEPMSPVFVEEPTPKEVLTDFKPKNQKDTLCGKFIPFTKALFADVEHKSESHPPTSATTTNTSDHRQLGPIFLQNKQENVSKLESGCVEQEKKMNPAETSICTINTIVTQRGPHTYNLFNSPPKQAPKEEDIVPEVAVTTVSTETPSVAMTTYAQYSQAVYVTNGHSVYTPPVNPVVNPSANLPVDPPFNPAVPPPAIPPMNSPVMPPFNLPVNPSFNLAVNSESSNQTSDYPSYPSSTLSMQQQYQQQYPHQQYMQQYQQQQYPQQYPQHQQYIQQTYQHYYTQLYQQQQFYQQMYQQQHHQPQ